MLRALSGTSRQGHGLHRAERRIRSDILRISKAFEFESDAIVKWMRTFHTTGRSEQMAQRLIPRCGSIPFMAEVDHAMNAALLAQALSTSEKISRTFYGFHWRGPQAKMWRREAWRSMHWTASAEGVYLYVEMAYVAFLMGYDISEGRSFADRRWGK